uniref:hypothetical protein n=1 Tax=Limnohabitans sp. TaxID=1907725 RepID=UPI0040486823
MIRVIAICLTWISAFLSGCATPVQYISHEVGEEQKGVHSVANKAVVGTQQISDSVHIEVLFEPTLSNPHFNGFSKFWIFVRNTGKTPFDFSVSDVSVVDKRSKPVDVLSLDEALKKLRKNNSSQKLKILLASSMIAALEAAPYTVSQQSGVYTGYDSSGRPVSGVVSTTGYNPTVGYLSQQRSASLNAEMSRGVDASYNRALANIQRFALRPSTLKPGDKTEGVILLKLPNFMTLPNTYQISIRAGDTTTTHSFSIKRTAD